MSDIPAGKTFKFPKERRLELALSTASNRMPSFPVERVMHLGDLSAARKGATIRISWTALFLKAYGLLSAEQPELRQVFRARPLARIYEHPHSVASVSVQRESHHGQGRLIWVRFPVPESKALVEIQERLELAKNGPLESVFRDGLRLEKLPLLATRMLWHFAMNWAPRLKARKLGTFSISSLAGWGASNHGHPLVVTSSLSFRPCDEAGNCIVTIIADHRILDGVTVAKALARLEELLTGPVQQELIRAGCSKSANPERR